MKKYIYLIIGFLLLSGLPSVQSRLVPPVDDYSRGFNFGVIGFHLLGFVFIFLFFRNYRRDKRNKIKAKDISVQ